MIKIKDPDQDSIEAILWSIFSPDKTKENFAIPLIKVLTENNLLTFNEISDEKIKSFILEVIKKDERSSYREYIDFSKKMGYVLEFEELKDVILKDHSIFSVWCQIAQEISCAEKESRKLLPEEKNLFVKILEYAVSQDKEFWEENKHPSNKNLVREYQEFSLKEIEQIKSM